MTRALLLLALLAAGCSVPLPQGVPLANAEPAVSFVLGHYGAPNARRPVVYGVPSDCIVAGGDAPGFTDPQDGECVSGLRSEGDIWITLHPRLGYNHALCHEVAHHLWDDGDHKRADLWSDGGREEACGDALFARADLDAMAVRR
jgi:hypothetical protein